MVSQAILEKDTPQKHKMKVNIDEYRLHGKCNVTLKNFSEGDRVTCPHKDLLIITLRVGSCNFCRILIKMGRYVNLLLLSILQALGV